MDMVEVPYYVFDEEVTTSESVSSGNTDSVKKNATKMAKRHSV